MFKDDKIFYYENDFLLTQNYFSQYWGIQDRELIKLLHGIFFLGDDNHWKIAIDDDFRRFLFLSESNLYVTHIKGLLWSLMYN